MKEEKLQKSWLKFLALLKNLQIFRPAFAFFYSWFSKNKGKIF